MRALFQILVIPFFQDKYLNTKYIIFKRRDNDAWQFIAGGGEDNEKPIESAIRESKEEAGIISKKIYNLNSLAMIPVNEKINTNGFML